MGSAVGGLAGAFVSQDIADKGRRSSEAARNQALAQWLNVKPPTLAEQQLNLQQYGNAGDLVNQLQQAQQLGPSAMQGIQVDPRLAQAQMDALSQLSQTGQMGMTPAEAAALASAQQNAAAQAQAKSRQIQDDFARRGMGGSGAELASQLSGAQAAAQMLSNNSNQVAQNAQQNALQAVSQSGALAGQMGQQQFGQQADIARAKDYINQFNLQNSQNTSNANVGLQNQATQQNLLNKQNLMNMNTQLGNQQQQHNKQLLQQQFNNEMALASGRAGQYQGIAQANQQNAAETAKNTANMWAGIGRGVDTGIGAATNYSRNSGGGGGDEGFSTQEENDWLNSDSGEMGDFGF